MNPKQMICELARTIDAEHNIASDLWSWLPSSYAAMRYHGHTPEVPPIGFVMWEANMVIQFIMGVEDIDPDFLQYFDHGRPVECPSCGDFHAGPEWLTHKDWHDEDEQKFNALIDTLKSMRALSMRS